MKYAALTVGISCWPYLYGNHTLNIFFYTGVCLIYCVVLVVSGVQRSDFSYTYVCSVAQSCLTLCDPMDRGPLSSSVHGIFQARMLAQVAISDSQGILLTQGSKLHPLCLLDWQADSYTLCQLGSPDIYIYLFFFRFFPHVGYYRVLCKVPCAVP